MVRIIAHRGSSALLPENSLAAFRRALAGGADALEVDIRSSKDGVLYCIHDHRLGRLTGYSGLVARTTARQIDRLRLLGFEPLLRLENFLEEFGSRTRIVLDIKSAGIEEEILQLTAGLAKKSNVTYSSFNSRILQRIKTQSPKARTALILGPLRNLKVKLDLGSYIIKRLTKLDCSAAHLSVRIAKPKLVHKLLAAGFDVAVWTVDEPETALKLAESGVRGIITNRPESLVAIRSRLQSAAKLVR